jgi:ribose 5-phosphate isomerase A
MSSTVAELQLQQKRAAAAAALQFVEKGMVLGVGTGSTVNAFIDQLGERARTLAGAVSSSEASTSRLAALGVPIVDLNDVEELGLYVDGADEANDRLELIKGGGAALTREKIVAAAAKRFVCIVDESKRVTTLGNFPLPVEVIPMARALVARHMKELGARPVWRQGVVTDNGNHILDLHGLRIEAAVELESRINQVTGVVAVGLFAARPADLLIVGGPQGVREITASSR